MTSIVTERSTLLNSYNYHLGWYSNMNYNRAITCFHFDKYKRLHFLSLASVSAVIIYNCRKKFTAGTLIQILAPRWSVLIDYVLSCSGACTVHGLRSSSYTAAQMAEAHASIGLPPAKLCVLNKYRMIDNVYKHIN
jgi:hypothetical protein